MSRSQEKNYYIRNLRCQISYDPVATARSSETENYKSPAAGEKRRGSGRTRYLTGVSFARLAFLNKSYLANTSQPKLIRHSQVVRVGYYVKTRSDVGQFGIDAAVASAQS